MPRPPRGAESPGEAAAASWESARAVLGAGIERLGVEVDRPRVESMLGFLQLLARWNRVYNLTAVVDPVEMVRRHALDSVAVAPYLKGPRVLDVGTGPGLPGIILALAFPEHSFVLLDASEKRGRFCCHALGELRICNAAFVRSRLERYDPPRLFTDVISRAFGSLRNFVPIVLPLLEPGGRVLAMKGQYRAAELEELGPIGENARIVRLEVPELDAERHVVVIDRHS